MAFFFAALFAALGLVSGNPALFLISMVFSMVGLAEFLEKGKLIQPTEQQCPPHKWEPNEQKLLVCTICKKRPQQQ